MTTLLALMALTSVIALRRRRFDLFSIGTIALACLVAVVVQHLDAVGTAQRALE